MTKAKQKPRQFWLVMRIHMWDSLEVESNLTLPFPQKFVPPSNGAIGFIDVFDNQDKAIAAAQDGDIILPMVEKQCQSKA